MLSTLSTNENINRKISALHSISKKKEETETEYLIRFVILHTACVNYLRHSRLNSLLVNGLDSRLRNAVRSFVLFNPNIDMGALFEATELEGNTIRDIIGSAQKQNLPTITIIKITTSHN